MNQYALEYGIKLGLLLGPLQTLGNSNEKSLRFSRELRSKVNDLLKNVDGLTIDEPTSNDKYVSEIYDIYQYRDLDKYYGILLGSVASYIVILKCNGEYNDEHLQDIVRILDIIPKEYLTEQSKDQYVEYIWKNYPPELNYLFGCSRELLSLLLNRSDKRVFISYRRDTGSDLAGRISDSLVSKGIKTFFDMSSMKSGEYDSQIFNSIDESDAVIVILSPKSLDRCIDENDWVRQEIRRAFNNRKKVIPVIMNGFEFPKELPEDISRLRLMEGVHSNSELYSAFIDRIIQLICD